MPQTKTPIDPVLTAFSVATFQDPEGFIADSLFPRIGVDNQAGQFQVWPTGELLRDTAQVRAPGTESAGEESHITKDTYATVRYALHKDITDQERANYRKNPHDPEKAAAKTVGEKLRLRRELAFASAYLKAGVWGTDVTGVAATPSTGEFLQWNDDASDPIGDVNRWTTEVIKKTGKKPNVLALGWETWSTLRNHPDFIERVKYTSGDPIPMAKVAAFFDVEKVVVGRAIVNTGGRSDEDTEATVSNSFIFPKGAWLGYVQPNVGIDQPTAGATFVQTEMDDSSGEGVTTKMFRMEEKEADRVEANINFDMKIVAKDLGLYAASVIA